jgi:bifunctional non-homologous end joining protein LigD
MRPDLPRLNGRPIGSPSVLPLASPMSLASVREPFDDPDWIFEPKWDGFRALAYIEKGHCKLVSRRGHVFKSWPHLSDALSRYVRCSNAVLDGEICSLASDGRAEFYNLLFRRSRPYFMAFDLPLDRRPGLAESSSLRAQAAAEGSPAKETDCSVRLVQHIESRGCCDLFRAACEHDLEGIVAKWRGGTYQPGPHTSWLKIRNPHYSQWDGRRELFETRRDNAQRRARWLKPQVVLR